MRTNIELDDDLLDQAGRYSTVKTKRAIVAEALAVYVAVKEQERRRTSYRDRLREVRKRTAAIRPGRCSHQIIREDRERR